ncbi:zinc finger protein 780A-like [Macrosteles quadrilineatus]|uniref:zinc finger protein 780A-like n=1 Tax=Macrosteles quadrilineatus TaxID=74068 RepID=UPI0023E27D1D|nr:zinc finger protein 780A-like [Macrosteles quadrilineatus]
MHRVVCGNPSPPKVKVQELICKKCGRTFKTEKTLILHNDFCMSMPDELVCKCGRQCKNKQGLSYHKRFCIFFSLKNKDNPDGNSEQEDVKSLGTNKKEDVKSVNMIKKEDVMSLSTIEKEEVKSVSIIKKEKQEDTELVGGILSDVRDSDDDSKVNDDNSTNPSEIVREITEDFSDRSTPTNEVEQVNAVLGFQDDESSDDEEEYYRHIPSSPETSLPPTPITVNTKSPEKQSNIKKSSTSSIRALKKTAKRPLLSPTDGPSFRKVLNKLSKNKKREEDFRCKCGAAFKTMIALKKHKIVFCPTSLLKCKWCPFQTRKKLSMRDHVLKKHCDAVKMFLNDSTSE